SATVGSPELISKFLFGKYRSFKILRSVETKDIDIGVESPTSIGEDEEVAKKLMIPAGSIRRIRRIIELVNQNRSTLVFTNTRENAEALSSRINALQPNAKIGLHHGSLSKEVRIETERELKDGELKAVICTSSLELGIDVGNIEFVIQYMSPRQVTKLTQRVGRSGHVIGAKSKGCIIAAWPDDILESVVISKFATEGFLETLKIHENALDVLAHQVTGMALDWGRIKLEEIYQTFIASWPYRNLSMEKLLAVVKQLEGRRILWLDGDSVRRRYPNIFNYYYENLSMITDVKHYDVVDFLNRRKIGSLDQEFIVKNGKPGQEFIIHGQTWRIASIDEEEKLVQVEPVPQSFGAIPAWEGEIIPVPLDVAQKVGRIRGEIAERIKKGEEISPVFSDYSIQDEAVSKVFDFVKKQLEAGYDVPTDRRIVIECFENYVILHCCFGDLINEALGKALASIMSARFGFNVATQTDAYRIALIAPAFIDPEAVKSDLTALKPEELEQLLISVLGNTSLLAWGLWNVAKRFGLIKRDAEYSMSRGRLLANVLQETPVYEEALREIYMEKIDAEGAKKVLSLIQSGAITVFSIPRSQTYSPFALPILDRIAPSDVLRPLVPTKAIIDVVKERLNSGEVRLVCLFKADYDGVRNVRSLPEKIRCPKCGYSLVAATYSSDVHLIDVAKKRVTKRKLTSEEEKNWEIAWKSANLVQTYGKKALVVLNARGVGPTTAVRILHTYHRNEDELYLDVIRAERNYMRTRMFWDK
ncbi:MAG: helicase-related protein, partial [Candidatus Bathyarchaeota archaeon]